MSRRSRRLHVRCLRAVAVAAAGTFAYQRWRLRASSALPASAYRPADGAHHCHDGPEPRSSRWAALQQSSADDPFDLLVVGGGLTGLYTAVDAAQRGLRVALVDAADFGGGSTTSCMPSFSPGALPYVQRAIRQRDWDWLRMAAAVLVEEKTWRNVAPKCVMEPDAPPRREQSWRWWGTVDESGSGAAASAGATEEGPAASLHEAEASARAPALLSFGSTPATTTFLPSLHFTEMVEHVCAALVSTLMSICFGPLRLNLPLSRSAVEARLPALAPSSELSSSPLQLRGGILANDFALRGNMVAVSLARTAEELGVTILSYAPVYAIHETSALTTTALGISLPSCATRASSSAGVMLVAVRDGLAAKEVDASLPVLPSRPWLGFLQQRLGLRRAFSPSFTADPDASRKSSVSCPDAATTTHIYARSVVNCTGCWADTVKAMYDGNASDTVPAAFAGYQAYSYLIAPANAVHAAPPPSAPPTHAHDAGLRAVASLPPLSETLQAAALIFSSPRLSFASAMVLPWYDRCVMLGPSISSLQRLPGTAAADTNGALHSVDGYAAQRQRTLSMLSSIGVSVDASRLLSCVSQIVPYVKGPKEVPWSGALLNRGYALQFSSALLPKEGDRDGVEEPVPLASNGAVSSGGVVGVGRRAVPLLHVYGGTPLLARRIAEDAVDALVHHEPPLFPEKKRKQLHRCRTRNLQLTTPASLCTTTHNGPMNVRALLETLVKDTYAERVVDVVARRTHVAYTSPAEALQVLSTLANVMGGLLQWDEARRLSEIEAARRFVHSVAVRV